MSQRTDKPIVIAAPAPAEQRGKSEQERRAWFRYPFTASAEVIDIRSQTRVAGRCSDLSQGGCYIDTLSPFAVGTTVRVRILRDSREFETAATVTYAHASMGMGIMFAEIKPAHQYVLRGWLAELNGETPAESQVAATDPNAAQRTANANMRQVLHELINLMVRKKMLTDVEGAGLLRQIFH